MVDGEVCIKISATLTFKTMDKLLMVMVEVDTGLRLDPLPSIIQVSLVDTWDFIFMVMR